ncbi:MAG: hypothetical protein ACXWQO_10975 [Bdellovibrionota bacterium]
MFQKRWVRGICVIFLNSAQGTFLVSSKANWHTFLCFELPALLLVGLFFLAMNGRRTVLKAASFSLLLVLLVPVIGILLGSHESYSIRELIALDIQGIAAAWWQCLAMFVMNTVFLSWYDIGGKTA